MGSASVPSRPNGGLARTGETDAHLPAHAGRRADGGPRRGPPARVGGLRRRTFREREGFGATGLARTGTPITIIGAGDIAGAARDAHAATADLIRAANPDAVFTTGDNAYDDGSASDYANYYDPTWGSFKDRTHPVPGNHEYNDPDAAGYVDYFGAARGDQPRRRRPVLRVGRRQRLAGLRAQHRDQHDGRTARLAEGRDVAAHPGRRY